MKLTTLLFLASITALLTWIFHDATMLARYIFQYTDPSFRNAFLMERMDAYLRSPLWRNSFYVHAAVGSLILFSGAISWLYFFPFRRPKLKRAFMKSAHRVLGRIYVWVVLVISAPTGFVMSFYAAGGWVTRINFIVLSVLWFTVTWKGYVLAKQGRVIDHAAFMTLSLGLASSAIVQRRIVYFWPLISMVFDKHERFPIYPISAVLGWILSVNTALWIIRVGFKMSPRVLFGILRSGPSLTSMSYTN